MRRLLASLLIRLAHRIYPPRITYIDGTGKRWNIQGRPGSPVSYRPVWAPGPGTQIYLDELENRGWN